MGEIRIEGGNGTLVLDENGGIKELVSDDEIFRPAVDSGHFELNGEPAAASPLKGEEGFRMQTDGASAKLILASRDEHTLRFKPDGGEVEKVGLVLSFPGETEFHLAEFRNTGRLLDRDMPNGEIYESGLAYNFFVARWKKMWIRFRIDANRQKSAAIHVLRHPSLFTVTLSWDPVGCACIAVFSSLEEATDDYSRLLEKRYGIRKMRNEGNLPAWVHNVKLVLTVDMLRSNWEISHDFADLQNLSRELKEIGCPEDTLIYIPGWQGAYDSTHPTYRPHGDLGGEEGFRSMIEQVHADGFRIMIHTTGWGIDPYHPDIDRLEKLVVRRENGGFEGWQMGPWGNPPKNSLKFTTGRLPLRSSPEIDPGSDSFLVETPFIPSGCEALLAIGGFRGYRGRVRLTVDRRSVSTPAGRLADHDEFDFPYPLYLKEGENEIRVDFDDDPDGKKGWYRIRFCFIPGSPYSSWTWPILRADTSLPEYIRIFTENIGQVVRDFDIDAVHVDATTFVYPRDNRKLLKALKVALPRTPINAEAFLTLEALGFFTFSQGAAQSLLTGKSGPREQGSLTVSGGLEQIHAWLNKASPVCDFAKEYTYSYPHLCASNGFVPIGKVCNTFPPRQIPFNKEDLWPVLRDAKRLGYVPGLRVNYRRYGLDEDTAGAIREIAGS